MKLPKWLSLFLERLGLDTRLKAHLYRYKISLASLSFGFESIGKLYKPKLAFEPLKYLLLFFLKCHHLFKNSSSFRGGACCGRDSCAVASDSADLLSEPAPRPLLPSCPSSTGLATATATAPTLHDDTECILSPSYKIKTKLSYIVEQLGLGVFSSTKLFSSSKAGVNKFKAFRYTVNLSISSKNI